MELKANFQTFLSQYITCFRCLMLNLSFWYFRYRCFIQWSSPLCSSILPGECCPLFSLWIQPKVDDGPFPTDGFWESMRYLPQRPRICEASTREGVWGSMRCLSWSLRLNEVSVGIFVRICVVYVRDVENPWGIPWELGILLRIYPHENSWGMHNTITLCIREWLIYHW